MKFKILKQHKKSRARVGEIETPHGKIKTPAFAPVGTQATVKALSPRVLKEIKTEIILANTYHLYLRPGTELIGLAGGLHKFMDWEGPILTDSGGFQVFSLSHRREITDEGVIFRSHIDGTKHLLTPEKVIETQNILGSDIMMPLDECVPYPCNHKKTEEALIRTTKWAKRSKKTPHKNTIFGLVQGGTYLDLRKRSAEEIVALDFQGYAVGGVSVGEPTDKMHEIIETMDPLLPYDKPRYLMGIGTLAEIRKAVSHGFDLFDCVLPTRLARHGHFFDEEGRQNLKNSRFEKDLSPLSSTCDAYCCRNFSKAYIRHLLWAKEILAMELLSMHNTRFMIAFMEKIRKEI